MTQNLESVLSRVFRGDAIRDRFLTLAQDCRFSDLTSLLLEVFRIRASKLTPLEILDFHSEQLLTLPSEIPQRQLLEVAAVLYSRIPPEFRSVEFPPVSPLGLNSVVTNTSQNVILSTIRRLEVISDVSTSLALEYARAKKARPQEDRLDFCSMQRVLRMQPFKVKGFTPHFGILAMASGNAISSDPNFEFSALRQHLRLHLEFLMELESKLGFVFRNVRVRIANMALTEALTRVKGIDRAKLRSQTRNPSFDLLLECGLQIPSITSQPMEHFHDEGLPEEFRRELVILGKIHQSCAEPLEKAFPNVSFDFNLGRLAGLGHYAGPCFAIRAENAKGEDVPLIDGGFTDWTQKLLDNAKERFLVSGIGTDLAIRRFGPSAKGIALPPP